MANTKKMSSTSKKTSPKKEENKENQALDPKAVEDVMNDEKIDDELETVTQENEESTIVPDNGDIQDSDEDETFISSEELKTVDLDKLSGNKMSNELVPENKEEVRNEQADGVMKVAPLYPKSKYTQSMVVKKYN